MSASLDIFSVRKFHTTRQLLGRIELTAPSGQCISNETSVDVDRRGHIYATFESQLSCKTSRIKQFEKKSYITKKELRSISNQHYLRQYLESHNQVNSRCKSGNRKATFSFVNLISAIKTKRLLRVN